MKKNLMVTRRNYATITAMMAVILFLFQAIALARVYWNDYDTNEYAESLERVELETALEKELFPETGGNGTGKTIVYVGDLWQEGIGSMVRQWGGYRKYPIEAYASLEDYVPFSDSLSDTVILDSAYVDYDRCTGMLTELARRGVDLIFCSLPDVETIRENEELQRLLGIRQVMADDAQMTGVHLFGGFLLGGETYYQSLDSETEELQDLDLHLPWYYISSGTKTYMMGILAEDDERLEPNMLVMDRNEMLPALIWRNSIGKANIFAVNGNFMEDCTGIGILDAMMYEKEPYIIYPVVNAQSLSVVNCPVLASENQEEMQSIYSRNQHMLLRDIVWPGITAVTERGQMKATCFMSSQLDYEDEEEPEEKLLIENLKLMKETSTEVGLSASRVSDISLEEKFERENAFLRDTESHYQYSALYMDRADLKTEQEGSLSELLGAYGCLEQIRTVTTPYEPGGELLGIAAPDITLQTATMDGFSHTYAEDLRMKSLETSLGYSNIMIDMRHVFWPVDEEERWEKLSEEFSSNTLTYWKPFAAFEKTSLTQSDSRVRTFLSVKYEESRTGDEIVLTVPGLEGEAWFLLRTHGERIRAISGAQYTEAEDDVYLLRVTGQKATVTLEKVYEPWYRKE